ncbi:MAG TPA: TraB/GumN family protein [Rhizomicrobium sp.]|jgi:hypothetical protein
MRPFRFLFAFLLAAVPAFASDTPGNVQAHPALWAVHGKAGTAYLLGAIHILPPNIDWHSPQIDAAMNTADTFVFEVPTDDAAMATMRTFVAAHGSLPAGQTLPSLLPPAALADYNYLLDKTQIPPANLADKKPWLADLVLQVTALVREHFDPNSGIDKQVIAFATAHGKSFRYFETIEQQLALIAPADSDLEIKEFAVDLKTMREEPLTIDDLVAAWEHGDVAKIDRLTNTELAKEPGAKKVMLDDRNKAWVAQLKGMLAENHTYFITVGAAHLAGTEGVPSLLRKEGYKVEGP